MSVVLDHHHDKEAGVYRLVIGTEILDAVPMLDEKGDALVDDDGQPILERVVVGHIDVHDYVFADDDERWLTEKGKRRAFKAVAAAQLALVREAGVEVDPPASS